MNPNKVLPGMCLAEGIGTFLMVFCGTGTVFVSVTTGALQGLWQVAVVWGIAIAIAIQITGAISGAHLNPAVTLAFSLWRDFPRSRVPAYLLSQFAGAFLAATVLFALFGNVLAGYEQRQGITRGQPGSERSAMVFGEYFPNPGLFEDSALAGLAVDLPRAMAAEGLGTAILVCCIFGLTDRRNPGRPRGALLPAGIGLTVAALIAVLAPLTQAGFNPARDFGPRLFAYWAGWGDVAIPGPRGGFFWVYIAAPVLGGLAGGGFYDKILRRFLPAAAAIAQTRSTPMSQTRFLLIGGFLAAGKTTALACLAKRFQNDGLSPGLIANDQSDGLVDTARLSTLGLPVAEITGGCFCCRFDALVGAARQLTQKANPDVILAEPVGSCTDLAATVASPLRRDHAATYDVGPLSVLVDPEVCLDVLGLGGKPAHSPDVCYIYKKQLEEADILVINKIDRIPEATRDRLRAVLEERFPQATVLAVSCKTGEGLETWLAALDSVAPSMRRAMDVDYDRYAGGEALLGWYNASADILEASSGGDEATMRTLAQNLQHRLGQKAIPIAHLKLSMEDRAGVALASVSVTRTDGPVETTLAARNGQLARTLAINLRAEAEPALLAREVEIALQEMPSAVRLADVRAFRPGRPNPTHRLDSPGLASIK